MKKLIYTPLLLLILMSMTLPYNTDNNPGDVVRAVFVDVNGNKWFGTDNGLLMFNGTEWKAYHTKYDLPGSINDIAPEVAEYGDEIWVATANGAMVAAYDVDGVTSATAYNSFRNPILNDSITSVAVDSIHGKWFGTKNGISLFTEGEWDTINKNKYIEAMSTSPVNFITVYNYGAHVAHNGDGVSRFAYDVVDGVTGASRLEHPWASGLPSANVLCIHFDENGDRWYGTDAGVAKHTGSDIRNNWSDNYDSNNGLPNDIVHAIEQDADQNFWFCTQGGVAIFDGSNFSILSTADGLASDTVYDISFHADTAWIGTHKGVSKIYPNPPLKKSSDYTIENFTTSDYTKDFIEVLPSGIHTVQQNTKALKVYPNPAKAELNIQINAPGQKQANLAIYNLNSQKVFEIENIQLISGQKTVYWNLKTNSNQQLKPGIYTVRIFNETIIDNQKVVIL